MQPKKVTLPKIIVPTTTPIPTTTPTQTPYNPSADLKTPQATIDPMRLTPEKQISPIATMVGANPAGLFFDITGNFLVVAQNDKLEYFSTSNYLSTKYYDTSFAKNDINSVGATDNLSMAISLNREWVVLGQWKHYALKKGDTIQRGVISVVQVGSDLTKILGQDNEPSSIAAPFVRVRFVPDNQKVAGEMDSGNGEIQILDIQQGTRLYSINSLSGLRTLDFSPDGKFYAVCANTGYIELHEVETGKLKSPLGKYNQTSPQPTCGVAFNQDGSQIAFFGDEHIIHLWNAQSYNALNNLAGHEAALSQIVFSPNNQMLASLSIDGMVRIWDIKAHREVFYWIAPGVNIAWVKFSPDNRYLLGGTTDGVIRIWRADGGQLVTQIDGKDAAFTPKGDLMATYTTEGKIMLWQVQDLLQ